MGELKDAQRVAPLWKAGDRLKRDHKGRPLFIEMPRRAELMEGACNDLWAALKTLTVDQLKALQPTGPYVRLVDALIYIRLLMGEDRTVASEIDALARARRSTIP